MEAGIIELLTVIGNGCIGVFQQISQPVLLDLSLLLLWQRFKFVDPAQTASQPKISFRFGQRQDDMCVK
jgi:hypothetical protein